MKKDNHSPLKIVKEFCYTWFHGQDLDFAAQYCSEDVIFEGVIENECVQDQQIFREYLRRDIGAHSRPCFVREDESFLSENIAIVTLDFHSEGNDCILYLHGVCTLMTEGDVWLLHHIHFVSSKTQPKAGEDHSSLFVKKKIDDTRQELLSSSIAGGLMGGYVEDDFPFYYVNDRMLAYLGYDSEEDFVRDIEGCIINCMHPEDRQTVDDAVAEQLAVSDEYIVEYRMRKKDGSYIYVHDIGKVITAEDGRPAILSVCIDISDQQLERQQNENMIRAFNGGTVTGVVRNRGCIPTYMSSGFGSIMGRSHQEMLEIFTKDFMAVIHPMDRRHFAVDQQRARLTTESVEGAYRFLHKDGHYVWVMAVCQYMGTEDGAPVFRYIFASRSKQFELQNKLLCGIDTGIIAIDPANHDICYANDAAFHILERPIGDYYSQKCYELLRGRTEPCDHCILQIENDSPHERYLSSLEKTLSVTIKEAEWMGRGVRIESLNDITEQKRIQKELRLGEQRLAAAIRHAGLQFWEYDMQHSRAYMSEFSQQSYGVPKIMEDFPASFLALGIVHDEDAEAFFQLHEKLKNNADDMILEFRMTDPDQKIHWQLVRYTISLDENGKPFRAFATVESVERLKAIEEGFSIAARLTGMRVWTVDMESRTIQFNISDGAETQRILACRSEKDLDHLGIIFQEDIHNSWQAFQKMFDGKDSVAFKARIKTGDKYRWNRIIHTVQRAKSGAQIKAIGVSIDIHEHVLLEQRFEQEMEYSSQLQASNLIAKVRCNITNGTVDLYIGTENTSITMSGASYDEGAENLALSAVSPKEQNEIRNYLNRERVQKAYENGENSYEIVYLRRGIDQTVFWAHTVVKTYQDPATGDLMSFMYTFNIDEQKIAETIVDRVVDTNFDCLTLFSAYTGVVERNIDKAGTAFKPKEGIVYQDSAKIALKARLTPEEFERCFPLFNLANITSQLRENGNYSFSFDLLELEHNQCIHKLWVFNWFDEQQTRILCSCSDITEVHRQEQRHKETLSAALAEAKQANMAKSNFLSQMSHEIRTPMNAIMGMTAIAKDALGNDERVADCLDKIDISSHFLLSLINDILDMSRIESGKTQLKSEKIDFYDFVRSVNTICYTQAVSKGIDYECIVSPTTEECYLGDAMRLQQVLVNILGNAIKFTDRGGKVTLSIEQQKRIKNNAALRFIISDTGIGMNEEFLPRLFMPFEQESVGITAGFGGTGLGLAISKNIMDLMNGKIQVRSRKGEGTAFTIDVSLAIPEKSISYPEKESSFENADLKALVVDENSSVCENAILTLKELGIAAEWADSGVGAEKQVREAWDRQQPYHLIFVDWEMSEPDAIEILRRIRDFVEPDKTTIILTAYDCYAVEQKAKAAGFDLLMNKPMLKSALFSIVFKALHLTIEETPTALPEEVFDFTGKRLLLVEDNLINAEIAEVLLKHVGFTVDCAENGQLAVEAFSETAVGYYDAILMDLRMPVMNGLQASSKIRSLPKEDAKTIPIIAMTADAFDEDAEKAKKAGMNLHLSKPIDPPMLYRTLSDFLRNDRS